MRLRSAWAVLGIVLLAGSTLAAPETATVTSVSGEVLVDPGGRMLAAGDAVAEGDSVTLPAGARLSLSFPDGSTMDVDGPARFRATTLTEAARTIDLEYGVVPRFAAGETVTGIRTPHDSFVAFQNSTVFVGIGETPEVVRTTYMLLEGGDAKVVDGREVKALEMDRPIVSERGPAEPAAPPPAASRAGESAQFRLGGHVILVYPKDGFRVQELPGGGIRLMWTADGFGMVNLDDAISLYLSEGESVEFSASGDVITHSGIIHVYAPLNRQGLYEEPIESPAAASATGTKLK